MPLQNGDFILIDYVARVKETNEVFDTTNEEIAKKEHLYKEGDIYEPKLVVIGEGWVLKTLDTNLTSMEVSKPATCEISPDQAFGPRDAEKVRRVPLKQLLAKEIDPVIGSRIEFNGKMATIRAVGAGRVLLDFNPPLAGKTLIYEVTVQKKLDSMEEQIEAIIHRRIPIVDQSKFSFTVKERAISVEMPEDAFYVEGIQVAKRGIVVDVQKFFPRISTVKFTEIFKIEPKQAEKKDQEEAKAEVKSSVSA